MVSSAFVHAILLKLKKKTLQFYHCSSYLFKRGMLLSSNLIYWLTIFKGTLCLGKEAMTIKQGPSPSLLQTHSTDPGHGFLQCLFWCV
jgi:hypothetical protein